VLTQRGKAYRSFFQNLTDELCEKHAFTKARAAQPRNFCHFTSGIINGVYFDAFFSDGERVVASVLIDVKDWEANRRLFDWLKQERAKIEDEFGSKLSWSKPDDVRACSIRVYRRGSIEDDAATLQDIHAWLMENLLRLKRLFGPRLHNYKKPAKVS
jgi:hypothetical protein